MDAEWSRMWIVGLLWLYPSTEIRESHWSDNDIKTNMRHWSVSKRHRKSQSSTSCFRSVWTNQRSVRDQTVRCCKAYWTVQTLNTRSVLNVQSEPHGLWILVGLLLWEFSFIKSGWNYIQRIKPNRTVRSSQKKPRDGDARPAAPAKTAQNSYFTHWHTISGFSNTFWLDQFGSERHVTQ